MDEKKKGSISTKIRKILGRKSIQETEDLAKQDLLNKNKDDLAVDVSQRRGITNCSGLSINERDYILSDALIASAIQLYLADILAICNKNTYRLQSDVSVIDNKSEIAEKEEKAKYILNNIFSDRLIESIGLNLLVNGEIFLNTKYNKGTNNFSVTESTFSRCTQLLFENGDVACYVCSDTPVNANNYNYVLNSSEDKPEVVDATDMVRVYNPTFVNSKIGIELDDNDVDDSLKDLVKNDKYLYYVNSMSLLKQIYPDWLNGKLLELAVYRDRIAKSRFIQLIALELGRTSRITSDQIYDSVKEYFDKRAVIDLEKQTFKSVVGNEPFIDYKVYTTRNGVGAIKFDSSLNGFDINVSSLADLDYNKTKVFAGLGIPKQYLGADDTGSALSNGGSLFFMSEKYQKRVIAYVKRVAQGLVDCVKNILIKQMGKEYLYKWDFSIEFDIPENNEDVYRVKNAKVEYANSILELVDKIEQARAEGKIYSIDKIGNLVSEDLTNFITKTDENNTNDIDENN